MYGAMAVYGAGRIVVARYGAFNHSAPAAVGHVILSQAIHTVSSLV